jgi:tetratricopeptide (TPR) repeat protein/DNA-binding CsgD family transcriptional regulator
MSLKRIILLSLLLVLIRSFGQEGDKILYSDSADKSSREMIDKYLSTTDSAEFKISELLILAKADEQRKDYINVIKKLEIALVLEGYVHKPDSVTFELNNMMGQVLADANPKYSIEFLKKAVQISSTATDIPMRKKFPVTGRIAGLYAQINEPDSALTYYNMAETEARSTNNANIAEASTQNNIGFFYSNIGKNDSALKYFNLSLQTLNGPKYDTVLFCSINDNIAQLFEKKNDYATAIKTYRFNDRFYLSVHRENRYFINKVRLINALDKTGNPEAGVQINAAMNFRDSNFTKIKLPEQLKFYKLAADYYFRNGMTSKAVYFNSNYFTINDSIEKQKSETLNSLTNALINIQRFGFKSEIEKHKLELERTKTALFNNRIIILTIIIAGIVIIYLLIQMMKKRKIANETEKLFAEEQLKRKELEARAMQTEIELKKKDLTNVVLHNTQVYDVNKKMIDRLENILKEEDHFDRAIRSLLIDLKNNISMSDGEITIQNNIDHVNAKFYEKLKLKFPNLTKSEVELCAYISINLSNKDIANLKNIEAASIKMGKNRLRKKLGINPDDDIYEFVRNI